MPTERKIALVAAIKDQMERASVVVASDHTGLDVKQIGELRRAVTPNDATIRVVKNNLALRAADDAGRPELKELLKGPTSFTFGFGDPIAPLKSFVQHIKEARLDVAIYGGWLDGKLLTAEEVQELAELPSKEQLLANIIGKLKSPLYDLTALLTTTTRNLAGLIEARAAQLEEEGAA